MRPVRLIDLGLSGYGETWEKQEVLMKEIIEQKLANQQLSEADRKETAGYLLFVEHPPVYTLGKSGEEQNLLMSAAQLADREI